jgi:hypothetical protein
MGERPVAEAMVEEMGLRLQSAAAYLAEAQERFDVASEAYWRARTHLGLTAAPAPQPALAAQEDER